jgi:predicted enzyme related to lactoylglutathione lyase
MSNPQTAFLGLRTVIYHAPDIGKAKAWYGAVLGIQPYFDQPFYVGFNVGGFELGLDPDPSGASTAGGVRAYWGVENAQASIDRLLKLGAARHSDVQDVGEGIRVATVLDPFGNIFGIIENPHFSIAVK